MTDFTNLKVPAGRKNGGSTGGAIGVAPSLNPKGIIERTLHTIHTIWIYPNGELYVKKPISWLDKKGTIVKKKEKKVLKVEESELGKTEEY